MQVTVTLLALTLAGGSVEAQTTTAPAADSAKIFEQLRFVDFVTSRGAVDPASGDVSPGSVAVQGIYMTANVSSSLASYACPVKFGFNPLQSALSNPGSNPIIAGLAGSVLEFAYTPVQLKQQIQTDGAGR